MRRLLKRLRKVNWGQMLAVRDSYGTKRANRCVITPPRWAPGPAVSAIMCMVWAKICLGSSLVKTRCALCLQVSLGVRSRHSALCGYSPDSPAVWTTAASRGGVGGAGAEVTRPPPNQLRLHLCYCRTFYQNSGILQNRKRWRKLPPSSTPPR